MTNTTCNVDGCTKAGRIVKGMCMMHYERQRSTGTTDPSHLGRAEARFWAQVDKTNECWNWTGPRNQYGYGTFAIGRAVQWLAHRYSWTQSTGEIAAGMSIDHKCHNPACIRPSHLREVTNKQNHEHLRGAYSNSKSGVRGVSWDKSKGLWRATVVHNYKQVHVGRYPTASEAEAAVVAKRLELFTHNDHDRAA